MKSTNPQVIDLTIYPTLAHKGFERAVEAGKISLDLAVQQNAEILAAIKKALKGTSLPGLFVLDLAGQAVEGFAAVQKQLLALALEQSAAAVEALQNFDLNSGTAKEDITAAFQASLDRSLTAQNVVTEYAAKQTKAVSEAVKAQPGIAGTAAETIADSMQRSFDTVLGVQKEMLNIAVKPLKAARA
jgi:hypothetical protein